jgi:hypothetical protein
MHGRFQGTIEAVEAAYARARRWSDESWLGRLIKAGSIAVVVVNAIFGVAEKRDDLVKWLDLDKCNNFDPVTGESARSPERRTCLFGRITFIKWTDPNHYTPNDVVDRPNRVLQVVRANEGEVIWGEEKLLSVRDDKETWESQPQLFWLAIQGGAPVPAWQLLARVPQGEEDGAGFVLRKITVVASNCANISPANLRTTPVQTLEFFIENAAARLEKKKTDTPFFVYDRTVTVFCDQGIDPAFRLGRDFSSTGFRLAQVWTDP